MKVLTTELEGVLIIEPDVFKDTRGYFLESFSAPKYSQIGIDFPFVQDNISKSINSTIRGLHYQVGNTAQGKLCQVIQGSVLDITVDIRFGSPTFGKHISIELSDINNKQIWIPPGFAHGFAVLSDSAIFHYKCTALYSPQDERYIIYNDIDLAIDWKVTTPLLSQKDLNGKKFKDIEKDFFYKK